MPDTKKAIGYVAEIRSAHPDDAVMRGLTSMVTHHLRKFSRDPDGWRDSLTNSYAALRRHTAEIGRQ